MSFKDKMFAAAWWTYKSFGGFCPTFQEFLQHCREQTDKLDQIPSYCDYGVIEWLKEPELDKEVEGLRKTARERTLALHQRNQEIKELKQRIRGLESMLSDTENAAIVFRQNWEEVKIQRDEARKGRDSAYTERNKLVALLAALFPAWKGEDERLKGTSFETVVYVDLPVGSGQISFHVPRHDLDLFKHVADESKVWDGHDSEEKWCRVARFIRSLVAEKLVCQYICKPAQLPDAQGVF